MSTHLPGFQSFFRVFKNDIVLAKSATSSIRVNYCVLCTPLDSTFVKLCTIIWTSNSYSIVQNTDMIARYSTRVCKIELKMRGSCLLRALLYMRKINTVFFNCPSSICATWAIKKEVILEILEHLNSRSVNLCNKDNVNRNGIWNLFSLSLILSISPSSCN